MVAGQHSCVHSRPASRDALSSQRSAMRGRPTPIAHRLSNELSQILFEHPMHTLVEVMLTNARALLDDDEVFPPLWTRPDGGNPDEEDD